MEDALVKRAAVIAEYTDTSIFVPERSEDVEEVPPEWFGMNPDYGEDSAEVIGSSVEEEDEAEAEGEAVVPEDGAGGQPQLDRASSNEPHPKSHLLLKATKQRLTSQPLHQPAPPTPPFRRTRLLLPRLPIYLLYFSCFISLDKLC